MSKSLESAVRDFLDLVDGPGKVEINGQEIQSSIGFSQEQFDFALDEVREALPKRKVKK